MKFKHKVYNHKRRVGFHIRGCGPNGKGIRGQNGAQIRIFVVSRQYFMEQCMDLSEIIPQGSIPEMDGYDWHWGLWLKLFRN